MTTPSPQRSPEGKDRPWGGPVLKHSLLGQHWCSGGPKRTTGESFEFGPYLRNFEAHDLLGNRITFDLYPTFGPPTRNCDTEQPEYS